MPRLPSESASSGTRGAPEQQAARHVAAAVLDQLGVLEEDDVLLDPLEHVVLAPHVGEPGLDVVGVVDVDAAPGQEPEQQAELGDREEQVDRVLEEGRQVVPQDRRDGHQRGYRRLVGDLARDDADDGDHHHPADDPADPMPRPRRELALRQPIRPGPDLLHPELVVARRALADQEVRLVQQLESGQDEDPPADPRLDPDRVGEPDERVVRHQRPDQEQPDHAEQDQPLDPVPDRQVLAGQDVAVFRPPALKTEPLR
jgi:hypothetical protein